ncbi:MAG: hypothetical protein MRZ79_23875 [Bacteroidia bacterium]|nr:hypothetical protein [Bacteroidia bacterium]
MIVCKQNTQITLFLLIFFLGSFQLGFGQKEEKSYQKLLKKNSILECNKFLEKYPDSKYTAQVKEKRMELRYEEAIGYNSEYYYQSFLKDYPNSRFDAKVKDAYAKVIFELAKRENSMRDFQMILKEFPDSKYAKITDSLFKSNARKSIYIFQEKDGNLEVYFGLKEGHSYTNDVLESLNKYELATGKLADIPLRLNSMSKGKTKEDLSQVEHLYFNYRKEPTYNQSVGNYAYEPMVGLLFLINQFQNLRECQFSFFMISSKYKDESYAAVKEAFVYYFDVAAEQREAEDFAGGLIKTTSSMNLGIKDFKKISERDIRFEVRPRFNLRGSMKW